MKKTLLLMISVMICTGLYSQNTIVVEKPVYPQTKKVEQVDNYFGNKINDPYRWLEDDNSAETKAWVEQQNQVTAKYLSSIPYRNDIKDRLSNIWNYEKHSVPFKYGDKQYFFANTGLQNQSILYVSNIGGSDKTELLDPNKLSEDGTVSLSDVSLSNDGKYLAYTISRSGSDWNEIYVMDVKKKKVLSDHILWVKFSSMAWNGKGFYYSCYDAPEKGKELSGKNEYHKVYYHKIGDKQSKDQLIYENKNFPLRNFYAQVTDDEHYLVISETESTSGNAMYVKDLTKPESGFTTLFDGFNCDATLVGNIDSKLYVLTNNDFPKYQVVEFDMAITKETPWVTVISDKTKVLESAIIVNNKIVVKQMVDATNRLEIFEPSGELIESIGLPGLGTIGELNGKANDNIFFYSFTSFTIPTRIFEHHIGEPESKCMFVPNVSFNVEDFTTEQVFYESFDGVKIPMFIIYKKGIELNGNNPALLYGYGGFNYSLTPFFSVSRMLFLENGGIYAIANIRGGGEYGKEWHMAGIKEKKQTGFNDFIAAAEYLIKKSYTKADKLAISGGSNGGLLVGACMVQRPDLFKVALPAVGVLDMLRYHKFTIGWAWKTDYGTSEDEAGFKYLYKYSPLHNIKKGVRYPATLITTADHDDRVVPAHSFKFAATLQECQGGKNAALIRIATKSGHGAGKPTNKVIEELSDVWAFTFYNLGIDPVFPKNEDKNAPKKKVRRPEIKDPYIKKNMPKVTSEGGTTTTPPKGTGK